MKSIFYDEEEQRLVMQSLKGDSHSQKCLYQKYAQAMFNIVVRMTADHQLSKDIVQDSFIKVFDKLDRFEGKSSLGAWIKRITINTALNHLKFEKNLKLEDISNAVDKPDNNEDDLVDLSVKQIHLAIKELPEKCRVVFNLYQMEGYNHLEIAEWLNISESTSKSQYSRAKKILRTKLKTRIYES